MATASHHPHGSSKPNYILEHAPPSALCLVRKLQTAPYQPLSPEQLHSVSASNLLSLRPPPHVAHQAVMDFYFSVSGHCGVACGDPSAIDLITVAAHSRSAGASAGASAAGPADGRPKGGAGAATAVAFATALGNRAGAVERGGGTRALLQQPQQQQQQQQQPQGSSPLGVASILTSAKSSSSEDYRLSQIRRNERHVNNAMYGKVCAFFNTREGCRRGPYCNFLHVSKSGPNIVSGNSGSPGAVLPHHS